MPLSNKLHSHTHEIKYLDELAGELENFIGLLVLNVFLGVTKNIGIKDPEKLALKSFSGLYKSFLTGLAGIGRNLKNILARTLNSPFSPFTVKGIQIYKPDGNPMTVNDWQLFEEQVINYLRPYLSGVAEEMAVKGILLGLASAEFDNQGKSVNQYGKKSYDQVEREQFSGYIPDTMLSMEDRFQIDDDIRKAYLLAHNRIAEYVTNIDDTITGAIKQQVTSAYRTHKDFRELASDMYWMADDNPDLKNYTVQGILRDWQRVAKTETAYVHEIGKLAPLEKQAKESIDNFDLAVYYVFNGSADCEWCDSHRGTIVRQIPLEMVGDEHDDSLTSRGIKDPYSNIAIWQGKNNVGYKQKQWRVCSPAHPWCGCSFSRIHPEAQVYDKKNRVIKYRYEDSIDKYMPQDILIELDTLEAKNREREDKQKADRKKGEHKKDKEYYPEWKEKSRK